MSKSTDVLTLVSRRYSENSSNTQTPRHSYTPTDFHTHPFTLAHTAHTRRHKHPPTHTRTHPCTCMYTHIHSPTYMYVHCTHMCTPAHTCARPRTLAHTHTHQRYSCTPGTPAHTPHIPADALNLINHMKLQ